MSVLDAVQRAIALRASFAQVHALELLDLVFDGHAVGAEEFRILRQQDVVDPQAFAFIATAFDRAMTEQEWRAWEGAPADPRLQTAVWALWLELIVPAFTDRYSRTDRPGLHHPVCPLYRATRTL